MLYLELLNIQNRNKEMVNMLDSELKKIVGDSFEDMSVQQMTSIQGNGAESAQTSPLIPISKASSVRCAKWVSAISGLSWAKHHK
ncbi:lichenicidin A2 family type 2 lantibiotic [Limosilactobacillus gastricus]|uniref:lichenicidin A2 family type 2 lantibiotic n=2 Tax=Limosilactobacillus gastricus TaxID=227942 RepID=UPI003B8A98EB